jgi:glutamine amidotransferase
MIAVVDAGIGNLRSVQKAVASASGAEVALVSDPDALRRADRIVVPGQGAFGDSARALRPDAPLGAATVELVRAGRPYLGICLGLQLLFETSEEAPGQPGLALMRGAVRRLPNDAVENGRPCKLPHIGWSQTSASGTDALGRALAGWFYFVHSYAADPVEPALVAAHTPFGGGMVCAAVRRDNVLAVQFHPEKSQAAGLALLAAFCAWKP